MHQTYINLSILSSATYCQTFISFIKIC